MHKRITLRYICLPLLLILFQSVECQLSGFADGKITIIKSNDTFGARQAAFGPRIFETGVIGKLIAVETIDFGNQKGCRPIPAERIPKNLFSVYPFSPSSTEPVLPSLLENDYIPPSKYLNPDSPNDSDTPIPPIPSPIPWIALVERGECSFVDKVRAMMQSGAAAVIVGDNERNSLITMYATGDTSDVVVPSLFVGMFEYRDLWFRCNQVPLKDHMIVWLTGNDNIEWPLMDILLVTIIAPILLILLTYTLYRLFIRLRPEKPPTSPRLILSLPTKTFFKEKVKDNEPTNCCICLEDFEDEEELRVLHCHHMFHTQCVDTWLLERKNVCPVCRAVVADGEMDLESGEAETIAADGDGAGVGIGQSEEVGPHQSNVGESQAEDNEETPLLSVASSTAQSQAQSPSSSRSSPFFRFPISFSSRFSNLSSSASSSSAPSSVIHSEPASTQPIPTSHPIPSHRYSVTQSSSASESASSSSTITPANVNVWVSKDLLENDTTSTETNTNEQDTEKATEYISTSADNAESSGSSEILRENVDECNE